MASIDKTYISSYQQYREVADWAKSVGTVVDQFGNKLTPYEWIPHIYEYDDDFSTTGIDLGEWTEEYVNEWLLNLKRDYTNRYKTEKMWKFLSDVEDYQKYDTYEKWCEYVDSYVPEIPLWNTGHVEDIWLIKNCPIDFIQDRLKVQYGGGYSKTSLVNVSNDSYEAIKNGTSVFDTFNRKCIRNPHFKIFRKPLDSNFKDDNIWWDITLDNIGSVYDESLNQWFFYEECHESPCVTYDCEVFKGNMSRHRIKRLLAKWNLPKGTKVYFNGYYKRRTLVKSFYLVIK